MSENTYNTDHGNFHMSRKSVKGAAKALRTWMRAAKFNPKKGYQLEQLLGQMGFEVSKTKHGDINDIFLSTSYFGIAHEQALCSIAPFVQKDSYLVFYGGGSGSCWALRFDPHPASGTIDCLSTQVTPVLDEDLTMILRVLKQPFPEFYRHLVKKYMPDHKKAANAKA